MKKFVAVVSTLSVLVGGVITPVYADKASPNTKDIVFSAAAIEEMTKLGMPSKMHEVLAPLIGTWEYTVTVWMSPEAKPEQSTGTSVNELILGGRFVSSKVTGILRMGDNFVPFEGQGLIGYDNTKKEFTSTWIDTMGTGIMVGSGKYDEKEKSIKETGHFTSPMKDGEQKFRSELQFTSADTYKYIMYTSEKGGKELKNMEIEYKKKM